MADRHDRLSRRFFVWCDRRVVSPCRMDWFKLQRFEKVFNASSTRIVTKKGVKWVSGRCDIQENSAVGKNMWLHRLENSQFYPLSQSIPKEALFKTWTRVLIVLTGRLHSKSYFHSTVMWKISASRGKSCLCQHFWISKYLIPFETTTAVLLKVNSDVKRKYTRTFITHLDAWN